MATAQQASTRSGEFRVAESGSDGYSTFHPRALPPDPPVEIEAELQALLDEANQALGRLDGITLLLPDPDQFLYTYVRKEAVLSSQIEGTQSSLSDLLLFEADAAPGVPISDARETSNYIAAMNHGLEKIQSGELPLCNRLLRDVRGLLLSSARGSQRTPGRFRREQNWIGGSRPSLARYVPPPWQEVEPAMSDLEKFLHDEPERTPILIKAALAHAQFETVHPFLDGNGRVGRLLITLLLVVDGVLKRPLLYLSLYLKQNRDDYYDHLQRIRTEGAWEAWLRFFLEGVVEVAESTTATTRELVHMIERDRQTIHGFGRAAATALRVHDLASRFVVFRPPTAAKALGLSDPPVYAAVRRLEEAKILREVTGRQRGKLYVYDEYLARLNEGTTEPAS
ncbi:MAG: Fic family protein [Solirubrobacterales bacterium]